MEPFPTQITFGELYGPAMKITNQAEADSYFERLVQHGMSFGQTREEAENIQRGNLGYFAGYYDSKTRRRVEKLFRCSHPVFGSIEEKGESTAGEAYTIGVAFAKRLREGE